MSAADEIGSGFTRGVEHSLRSKEEAKRAKRAAEAQAAANQREDGIRAEGYQRENIQRLNSASERDARDKTQHGYRMEEIGAQSRARPAGADPFLKVREKFVGDLGKAQANADTIQELGSVPSASSFYLREKGGKGAQLIDDSFVGPAPERSATGTPTSGDAYLHELYGRGIAEGSTNRQQDKLAAAEARKRMPPSPADVAATAKARWGAAEPFKRLAQLRNELNQAKTRDELWLDSDIGEKARARVADTERQIAELEKEIAGQKPINLPGEPTSTSKSPVQNFLGGSAPAGRTPVRPGQLIQPTPQQDGVAPQSKPDLQALTGGMVGRGLQAAAAPGQVSQQSPAWTVMKVMALKRPETPRGQLLQGLDPADPVDIESVRLLLQEAGIKADPEAVIRDLAAIQQAESR